MKDLEPEAVLELSPGDKQLAMDLLSVLKLMREYKIPEALEGNGKELDWDVRLFLLVLALAKTHPKHKISKKRGKESTWEVMQKGALVSDVAYCINKAKKSGEVW